MGAPLQVAHRPVGGLTATVLESAVAHDGAVEDLVHPMQHQIPGGVPGGHQSNPERQLLDLNRLIEHFLKAHELGVVFRIKATPIDSPDGLGFGVDLQAVDDADSLDQAMSVTAILQPHHLNFVRIVL